jgi:hypothetical protein
MAFHFKLEHPDGTPADPPTLHTAVPNWSPGDTIPLGHRTLRVVDVRDDPEGAVLVVGVRLRPVSAKWADRASTLHLSATSEGGQG